MAHPLLLTLAAVAAILRLPMQAKAQSSMVACELQYDWMNNFKAQNPCLVAAYLAVPCDGTDFVVDSLDSELEFYLGPDDQDDCQCNAVFYSLVEACQICQGSLHLSSWPDWTLGCRVKYTAYPKSLPPGTSVPQWALADVMASGGTFNVSAAQVVAAQGFPDSTAVPAPTSTSTSVTVTPTSSSSSTLPTDSTSSTATPAATSTSTDVGAASKRHSKVGAIVGGVVGGIFGLLLTGTLIFTMLMRQRRLDRTAPSPSGNATGAITPASERPDDREDAVLGCPPAFEAKSPGMRMLSPPPSTILYNPEDPRTYPGATDPTAYMMSMSRPTSPAPTMALSDHRHNLPVVGSGEYYQFGYSGIGAGYAGSIYKGAPEL